MYFFCEWTIYPDRGKCVYRLIVHQGVFLDFFLVFFRHLYLHYCLLLLQTGLKRRNFFFYYRDTHLSRQKTKTHAMILK